MTIVRHPRLLLAVALLVLVVAAVVAVTTGDGLTRTLGATAIEYGL